MYGTFCCLHGKTIKTKCNLEVAFSLNSWLYNKKVIIQLTVQYRHIFRLVQYGSHLGTCPTICRYCTVNCIITYNYLNTYKHIALTLISKCLYVY